MEIQVFIFLTGLQIHCVNIWNLIWKKDLFFHIGIRDTEFIYLPLVHILLLFYMSRYEPDVSCDHSIKGCSIFYSVLDSLVLRRFSQFL